MRINKLFSNLGICSRKGTNRLIEQGRVIVNGKACVAGQWVELDEDEILIDNKPIFARKKVYIALNKPVGITCTASEETKDNIINYMNYNQYIFPVGRLDKASQGLIIMTNDGELANEILEAENNHEKEYLVTLSKEFDDEFIYKMSQGVEISGIKTKPCKVERISKYMFKIILTQGLNKQIRKMSGALGYKVIKLERIRIMNIVIDEIEYGKWRYITEKELKALRIFKDYNLNV